MKLLAAGLLLPSYRRAGAFTNDGIDPGSMSLLRGTTEDTVLDGRILVIVNQSGGNDGLNTVVPITNQTYYEVRDTIAIPPENTVQIDADTGLHPGLQPLFDYWDNGRLAIIQGVSYPNPNLSHFRATDIWFSGSSSDQVISTGWLARYIEAVFPEFPGTLPDAPYGIQQSFSHPIPLQGDRGVIGVVISNPDTFYQLVSQQYTGEWNDELPDTRGGEELGYVRGVDVESFEYAAAIQAAAEAGTNTEEYPQTTLGIQLEIVARLISGNLDTPIFLTSEFGFDTHTNQLGAHNGLMQSVGYSLDAFMRDLDTQGLSDRVLVVTTSEFGRRVEENGGFGTDHGTAAPIFAMGAGVIGGMFGTNPDLDNLDPNGNLLMQNDYRSVYSTILQGHFGSTETMVSEVLMGDFDTIDFLTGVVGVGNDPDRLPARNRLHAAFPNPLSLSRSGRARLMFDLARPGRVTLEAFDVGGRRVVGTDLGRLPAGRHRVPWQMGDLAPGVYLYRVSTRGWRETGKLQILP